MGFATQMLALSFLGFFNAWLYRAKLRARNKDWSAFLWLICMVGMWTWGILVYVGTIPVARLVNWLPWVDVADGRDWMWNSFQLLGAPSGAGTSHPGAPHSLAVVLFLTYPACYLFGADAGRMMFGTRTYEGGYWWGIQPSKKPAYLKGQKGKAGKQENASLKGKASKIDNSGGLVETPGDGPAGREGAPPHE